ncbi:SDR family NAD(P)-dependent oxidoreductase [Vibrio genomosp. F10]|uniref:Dehydrogenase n=1 Tax=Vibrio genomosp. F10 TaxID=723171 RepID=A0A1B9QVR9_9VIBR|nr:SDR family NAD(P)-dependent oxidoreductase [Vibrio genomosp. F10]OCH73174.1 dehydrogenase [Vibrio genomosp. F10]
MYKTVLITGGTRGIGQALVKQYLNHGYTVIATGSSEKSVVSCKKAYPEVRWYKCNLKSAQSIEQFAQALNGEPLSLVIHNAGVQQARDLFVDTDEAISIEDETMINFTAPILLTRLLFDNVQRATGTWVFATSGLAIAPKQSSPIYCANKAGLRTFCKSFNGQINRHNSDIKVCEAILPLVDTEMTQGRGKGKISPPQAALEIFEGAEKGKKEIHIGKIKLVMKLRALFPNLIENIMLKE